jgi:uncharacterized protein (DUF58 family)
VVRWLKPPRTLAINSLGWYFIAFIFAVGLAAVNTGNNLLYLIFGGMLSFIVTSGILSNLDLNHLVVTRHLPEHLFARTPTLVRVEIENRKRRIPSFLLLVEARSPDGPSALIPTVGPGRSSDGFIEVVFPARGLHELSPLKVSTRFPFGLFTKGMDAADDGSVLVFPHLSPTDVPDFDFRGREGEAALVQSGQGSDPYSIKDFQPGDNPRHIHWKSSAKRGKLMRREFSKEQEPAVTIKISADRETPVNVIERKIEHAASLAERFIMEGYAVAVICGGAVAHSGRGRDHLLLILRELALLDISCRDIERQPARVEGGMVIEI